MTDPLDPTRERRRLGRRAHEKDLRAAAGLIVRGTRGVMNVVRETHVAIGAIPVITDLIYEAVDGVTGVVGSGIDAAVAALAPLLGESTPGPVREAVLAALNGVVGDHLEETANPLAIPMSLRPSLEGLHRGGALLVLIHGSCMNDLQWTRDGHDHGQALATDLGVTPAWLHYNSGRHTSSNGKELAELLERESAPFHDVILLGHSMGGLVARAAIRAAEVANGGDGHAWRQKLRALVTLGTPHHGAPLERGGNVIDRLLGATRYSAPLAALGQIRSAGVTDLRFGNVVDADWQARGRFAHGPDPRTPTPLPEGVRCYAVAGTRSSELSSDLATLATDNLVPPESALGLHKDPAFTLRFTDSLLVEDTNHLQLLSSQAVYSRLVDWLKADALTSRG